jgi:hypothetical protein
MSIDVNFEVTNMYDNYFTSTAIQSHSPGQALATFLESSPPITSTSPAIPRAQVTSVGIIIALRIVHFSVHFHSYCMTVFIRLLVRRDSSNQSHASRDLVPPIPSPVAQPTTQTVFYDRPASLIAYALTSNKYIKLLGKFSDLCVFISLSTDCSTPDNDRQTTNVPNLLSMKPAEDASPNPRHDSIADFSGMTSQGLATSGSGPNGSGSSNGVRHPPKTPGQAGKATASLAAFPQAIKIPLQFNYKGGTGNMHFYWYAFIHFFLSILISSDVYYASQFEQLRLACGISDKDFCDSLRDSDEFNPKGMLSNRFVNSLATAHLPGGKSGVSFSKTHDERFLLKNVSNIEGESFIEFAPQYFDYFDKVLSQSCECGHLTVFSLLRSFTIKSLLPSLKSLAYLGCN